LRKDHKEIKLDLNFANFAILSELCG